MRKVMITMHQQFYGEIHRFCSQAEAVGGPVSFDHVLLRKEEAAMFASPELDAGHLCDNAAKLKGALGLGDDDLLIVVVDGNLYDRRDDEYFCISSSDRRWERRKEQGVGAISMYFLNPESSFMREAADEWRALSESRRKEVTSRLVTLLLLASVSSLVAGLEYHDDTFGCTMDYCQSPGDILKALEREHLFCGACSDRLSGDPVGQAIFETAGRLGAYFRDRGEARIFISYAREDRQQAEKLYGWLQDAGFRPWMDVKDLLPGEPWQESIDEAIRSADFFIACLSPRSVSKRGVIQKEFRAAVEKWETMLESDIYLIPVRLEECEVPEKFKSRQWLDLFHDESFQLLQRAIQAGIEQRRRT